MESYCVKCRKKVEVEEPQVHNYEEQATGNQGFCPHCGTKVFRIGKE